MLDTSKMNACNIWCAEDLLPDSPSDGLFVVHTPHRHKHLMATHYCAESIVHIILIS